MRLGLLASLSCFSLCLCLSLGALPVRSAEGVPLMTFLDTAFVNHRAGIETMLAPRYATLCRSLGVSDTAAAHRDALMPLLFLHALLTTQDAVDCRIGGILATTYLWHWTTPNPRHALRRLPDSALLSRLPPPPGYGKYKSWADVDRLPALYLGDLFTYPARYWHPVCGTLWTFGWCSEREMAFGALMAARGIRFKIKQEGIHVWTEILLDLRGPVGKLRPSVVALDHTFDTVEGWRLNGSAAAWAADYGDGAQVAWYNKTARSPEEVRKVKGLVVERGASIRIHKEILAWQGIIER